MQVRLRPANESDIPFLLDLRLQTIHEHFVASGVNPSRDEHMQRVLYRFDCAQIIVVDGEGGGLLKLDRAETPWHLMQIQIARSLQRRGVGTQLLGEMIREARSEGVSIRLGVAKVNPARRLYERLGFVVVRETADSLKMNLQA